MDSKRVIPFVIIAICAISLLLGFFNTIIYPQKSTTPASILEGKIAMVKLDGIIQGSSEDNLFKENNDAESVRKTLKKAASDQTVKGILLRINSPGGTVAESQEIYSLILQIRKQKPVFVSMGDVTASGGYYISSAADRIYADPGTLTGSIGVIFSSPDMSNLLNNKLGIKPQVIKSGKYKDIGSGSRPMTKDEKTLLNNIIQNSYKQFLAAITKGRINRKDQYKTPKTQLTQENLKKYADGRVFTGEQAKSLGFVDELGGIEESYTALNSIVSPHRKLPLTPYNKEASFSELFSSLESTIAPKAIENSLLPFSTKNSHKLLYIWE